MKKLLIPPVFVLIGLVLIIVFYYCFPTLNIISFPYNFSGVFISIYGFALMGKSRELFKKHKTTLDIKKSDRLITEGVFSKTRNPMYIGMFLLLLGAGICFMNVFSAAISFLFILLIQVLFIPKEEKMLEDAFGNEYVNYKEKVKRWI